MGHRPGPKGFVHEGTPWSFASHRISIPAATYSEGDGLSVALFGNAPTEPGGLACSLIPAGSHTTHRLIWPEEEQPKVYTAAMSTGPASSTAQARRRADVHSDGISRFRAGQSAADGVAAHARSRLASLRARAADALHARAALVTRHRLRRGAMWAEEGIFRGFNVGLMWKDGRFIQRRGTSTRSAGRGRTARWPTRSCATT